MEEILKNLPEKAKDKHKENKKFFAKLRKKPP
ncbi:MAG: YkgJ family cysteine cluster protein, partial [Salegentibacter mishustinae]|nr:YkgJ family cysteine cluster protein [Salegentibacter mishustinae]